MQVAEAEHERRRPGVVAEARVDDRVDAEVGAVLPLNGGRPLADPFERTADLVELLQVSAGEQLRGRVPARSVLRRPLWLTPRAA